MNNNRRKELRAVLAKMNEMQAALECILSDEEESRDNTPESLQSTDSYATMESACDSLQQAISTLETAAECVEQALE